MSEKYEFLEMADGEKVRLGFFEPNDEIKGVIQIIHGFGEYIGHYLTVIDFLTKLGYVCVIHDQRGHGVLAKEFPKTKGIAENYEKFLSDSLEIREWIGKHFSEFPVFIFGHSMGGNIVLNLLIKYPQIYQKAVIESPWLDLAEPPLEIVQVLAKFLGKISPNIRIHTHLKVEAIAHDTELVKAMTEDGFYHDVLSLRLFTQIKEAGKYVQKHAKELNTPSILFCAEQDGICSAPAIRDFAKNTGDNVKFVEIAGGYHALHLDTQSQEFLVQMTEFLL
ncbi:alpha/beta fold hydrolase [Lactococcus nasutitermitis]|uniref:Alpha/beta fold hydrolase n=1 Tax=Lactococcus nasutitermitis TaxID=1652957 RepID=A0ABV9JBN0_9LACT|nr:alpha/beta fold hydrolase [Lactococcus nasutitermitis]